MPFRTDRSRLRVQYSDYGVLVRLVGCEMLDEQLIPTVQAQLFGLAAELGPVNLTLDLEGVRMLTSTGLGMLVSLHKQLHAAGGSLTLRGLNDTVHEVFEVTLLTRVLDIR
jgi:anti-sigma B factor antagonist